MDEPEQSEPPESPESSVEETLLQNEQQRLQSQRRSARNAQAGMSVPGYETLECLGEGAFGSVWLARERKTSRLVAIKFFSRQRGLDWALLTREVEKLAVLDASRDVVRLFDVGWDHDPPYFVMEYLEAGSVSTVLQKGPLSVERAVDVTKAIARALVHAHGAGILHCDIKPANVLLDRGGAARLGDFGQSRLTTELSPALGTLFYMAPDQAVLKSIPDARWDVYSLGAMLYHMVTGSPPYRTAEAEQKLEQSDSLESRLNTYRQIIRHSPAPDAHRRVRGMDQELATIIDGCLDPDPQKRLANAQVVLDRLELRDRHRAHRPLIWLGFLGPLLLMLAVAWIASTAVPKAVSQASQNLFDRALASDAAAVKILATSIEQELKDRQYELEHVAGDLVAGPATEPYGFVENWEQVLTDWQSSTEQRLIANQRKPDQSLFLTDAEGYQRFRIPADPGNLGVCFSHRDYFHGLGRELPPAPEFTGTSPRETPGISVAFRSTVTHQYMVAIAVPIWDREHKRVLGVLGRTIHIIDLLSQWEDRIRVETRFPVDQKPNSLSVDDIFLSLVDTREHPPLLLDHHWMTTDHLEPINDDQLKKFLTLNDSQVSLLTDSDRQIVYRDPMFEKLSEIGDPSARNYAGDWLAANSPVGNLGWIAIIQERRSQVVAPMLQLYDVFLRYGLWTLIVFTGLLVGLWLLIQRATADRNVSR